jgi:hypothetical protein
MRLCNSVHSTHVTCVEVVSRQAGPTARNANLAQYVAQAMSAEQPNRHPLCRVR